MQNITVAQKTGNAHPPIVSPTEFLGELLPPLRAHEVLIGWKRNSHNTAHRTIDSLIKWCQSENVAGNDAYFAMASFNGETNDKGKPSREADRAVLVKSFWLDIDVGEGKAEKDAGYATKKDALAALRRFIAETGLAQPTIAVSSGGGLHIYWVLTEPVTPDKWKPVATALKAACARHGFLADPSRTSDIASVLRPVGTHNHKTGTPRPVTARHIGTHVDFAVFSKPLASALGAHDVITRSQFEGLPAYLQGHGGNLDDVLPPETTEGIERMQSALNSIPPDCNYSTWRNVIWSVLAHGWGCCEGIAREWSMGGTKYDELAFLSVVRSFKP